MCTLYFIFLVTFSVWFSALFFPLYLLAKCIRVHAVASQTVGFLASVFGLCYSPCLKRFASLMCTNCFFLKRSLIPTSPPPDAIISHFFKYLLQSVVLCGTSMLCHKILTIWVLVSLVLYFPSCLTQCHEHVQCVYRNI